MVLPAWTGSLSTNGVASSDVLLGEVGEGEPSTTNQPIITLQLLQ